MGGWNNVPIFTSGLRTRVDLFQVFTLLSPLHTGSTLHELN